jgi:hypothetical protein
MADGYSTELFDYIVGRSRKVISDEIREGEIVVTARDLSVLDDLQWSVFLELTSAWNLRKVDSSENFVVYETTRSAISPGQSDPVLPSRPIRHRTQFPE